jgi:hypothetical protein
MAHSPPITRRNAGAVIAAAHTRPTAPSGGASGKDSPRSLRVRESDGHIPADWFRRQVWYPAREAAGLDGVRVHDLRHTHASWLLAGGADLQAVKECLGHSSIATTEKYLHSLPTADETALDALTKIRRPSLVRSAWPGERGLWLTAGAACQPSPRRSPPTFPRHHRLGCGRTGQPAVSWPLGEGGGIRRAERAPRRCLFIIWASVSCPWTGQAFR